MAKEMRGLSQFISSLRGAENKEDELSRVNKELVNIRAKFTSTSQLSPYDQRKYIWKLVYMYMLGYNVEIGHMVAIGMVGSKNILVKQVGYTACSILFTEKSELLRLVIQTLKQDLASSNDVLQSLALVFIANMGNAEFAESLANDVQRILFHPQTRAVVRKKAALSLLRLFRKNPDTVPQEPEFHRRVTALLDDGNIGVLTAVASLVLGLVSISPDHYDGIVAKTTVILTKVCFADPRNRSVYKYYNTICPWLQVKLLRVLQYFPAQCAGLVVEGGQATLSTSEETKSVTSRLQHVLHELCVRTVLTKNMNKNNGDHSILFEAIHLILASARACHDYLPAAQVPAPVTDLVALVASLLAKHIAVHDPNYRYLGLDNLTKLSQVPGAIAGIRAHQAVILNALHDADISIRKRALDLLYAICDESNVEVVVGQLVEVLYNETLSMRQDIVLKIVILAEKYSKFSAWYVQIVMQLASTAGQCLSADIWYRVVQIITNHEQLQAPAVLEAYKRVADPELHANSVRLMAYVLGEFTCKVLDDDALAQQVDANTIFTRLQAQFRVADDYTKAIMLCAYAKLAFTCPEVKPSVDAVMAQSAPSLDVEVQQRATELTVLAAQSVPLLELVLDVMPQYEDMDGAKRSLERQMNKAALSTTDRDVWTQPEPDVVTEAADLDDDMIHADVDDDDEVAEEDEAAYPEQRLALVTKTARHEGNVIYQSANLSVTSKMVVDQGCTGKMILVVTNSSAHQLTGVSLALPNMDALRVQVKPASLPTLAAGASERFLLLWQSVKPFDAYPVAKLTFAIPAAGSVATSAAANPGAAFDLLGLFDDGAAASSSVPMSIALKLPVLPSLFVIPNTTAAGAALTGSSFLNYWRQLGNQAIAKVHAGTAAYASANALTQLVESQALPMAIISGCDNNPHNMYLSGTFVSHKRDAQGNNVKVDVLVRAEFKVDAPVCRITVNSGSTSVSAAIMSAVVALLNGKVLA